MLPFTTPQIHAGGAHLKERDANRQPRSRGVAIERTSLLGSEEPAGGAGPRDCAGGS